MEPSRPAGTVRGDGPLRRARLAARSARRAGAGGQPDRRGAGRRRRHRDPRARRRPGHRRARGDACPRTGWSTCSWPRSPRSTASTSRTSGPSSASPDAAQLSGLVMAERMVAGGRHRPGAPRPLPGHLPRARVRLGDGGADGPARRGGLGWRRALARRGWAPSSPESRHLESSDDEGGAPPDLAWAALGQAGLELAAGRPGRAFRSLERQQLALLARVADGVVMSRSGVGPAT